MFFGVTEALWEILSTYTYDISSLPHCRTNQFNPHRSEVGCDDDDPSFFLPLDKSSFCTAFHIFPVIRSSVHSSILVSPEGQLISKISSYTFLQLSTTHDRWHIRQQPHQTYTKHHHIVNMALEVERERERNCSIASQLHGHV